MRDQGKPTQLDSRPDLDYESLKLWNVFACLGDDTLLSLDIYENRVGFPFDWQFEEVLSLVHSLGAAKAKLTESLKNG